MKYDFGDDLIFQAEDVTGQRACTVVAITLVELGMPMHGIRTALDVEKGMSALQTALQGDLRPDAGPIVPID